MLHASRLMGNVSQKIEVWHASRLMGNVSQKIEMWHASRLMEIVSCEINEPGYVSREKTITADNDVLCVS